MRADVTEQGRQIRTRAPDIYGSVSDHMRRALDLHGAVAGLYKHFYLEEQEETWPISRRQAWSIQTG
jgi:hypothetical protein